MAIATGIHEFDDVDRAGFAHALEVVAPQVNEHDVLGALLGIGKEVGHEVEVVLRRLPPGPGPGDGMEDGLPTGDLDVGLR